MAGKAGDRGKTSPTPVFAFFLLTCCYLPTRAIAYVRVTVKKTVTPHLQVSQAHCTTFCFVLAGCDVLLRAPCYLHTTFGSQQMRSTSFAMRAGLVRLALAVALAVHVTPAWTAPVSSGPVVDLGYASYRGYHDVDADLDVWKGIRYAAAPVGKLRWQAPQPPLQNDSSVTSAVDPPPLCPQTGAFGVPAIYGFNSKPGNEDCLYLNVYAPPNADKLPVFMWIRKYIHWALPSGLDGCRQTDGH